MHEVYKLAPDFSPELYRELNDDLKPFNDIKLFEHYYNYGRYEVRVYSYSKFYGKYRDFSIELYRELHDDLKSFTDIKLFGHYHKYGCREGRISSYNKFYEKYLYFSLELYRELYDDLESFNDIQLFGHYHNYGHYEERIYSYNKFYEIYPNFDIEFYRNCNYDLESFTDIQLFGHYHKYGYKEGRISSYNKFYEVYPNFDVEFYRRFNTDINLENDIELFGHFHKHGFEENRISNLNKFYEVYPDFDINVYLQSINLISNINIQNLDNLQDLYVFNINNDNIFNEYMNYSNDNVIDKINNANDLNKLRDYFYWNENNIENKKISINCPFTQSFIQTEKYFLITYKTNIENPYLICNYYFDTNIILGIGLGTGLGALETKILYIYNISQNLLLYNWYEFDINTFKKEIVYKILLNIEKIKNTDFNNLESRIITIYGYMNNLGHNLFNDNTGFFLLDYFNIINYIDTIYFGNHDPYLIKDYIIKSYNKIKIIDDNENIYFLDGTIGKGIFFKYNHQFISNKCNIFLKNRLYKLYHNKIDEIRLLTHDIKDNHYPIINVLLRKGYNEMINQEDTISDIINKILLKYPNAFFYFDGFCKNPYLKENNNFGYLGAIKNYNDLVNEYNEVVDLTVSKINTTNYLSLINMNSYEIIEYVSICNYAVYQVGSACTISGWVCNIPGIQFGRQDVKIYEWMDIIIREDNPKIIYLTDGIRFNEDKTYELDPNKIIELLPEF